jgi:hypothetical protein
MKFFIPVLCSVFIFQLKKIKGIHSRTHHEGQEREWKYIALLCLSPRRSMRAGGQHHAPAALTPGKILGTKCTRGWVGPRVGLDKCGKSRPYRDSIPEQPSS